MDPENEEVDGATREDMLGEIKTALGVEGEETPPVETPPVETPPVETPPVETPPVETPPVETPPATEEESIIPDVLLNPEEGEEEEEIPADLDEKGKNAFVKMRHALGEKDTAIKELQDKLSQQGDPEAVVKLREELKTAHDAIGRLSLEHHPEFQAKFEAPKNAIVARVKDILQSGEYDAEIADKAAGMNTIERIRYLNEVAPDLQPALTPMFGQYDTIDAQRDTALENFKTTSEALQSEIETRNATQRTELTTKVFSTALSTLQEQGHFAYSKVEGKESWNTAVDSLVAKGRELLNSADVLSQTQAVVAGLASPMYLEVIKKQNEQIRSLNAELGKKSKVRRKISSSDGAPPAGDKGKSREGMSTSSMADEVAKRMEERRKVTV